MTAPRNWPTIKSIFTQAIQLAPDQRDSFVLEAGGGDSEIRAEVQALLVAHDDERPFLDAAPIEGAAYVLSAVLEQTDAPALRLPAATRVGQYELLEPLGSGGMGEVYRARDTKLDRLVALKIVLDSARGDGGARVLDEARAASALNHPNVCTVYETGEFDGQPYLAMEYIAGQPLSSLIPPEGFDPTDVIHYGVQIADALSHAHEHGVVHRDLKAANVVVTPERRAKVLDFGIAKRVAAVATSARCGPSATAGGVTETAATARSGTLAYMAPELLRGRPADSRTDIWALGVLLYEMVCGRRPFVGDDALELTAAILNASPLPLPAKVPVGLRDVITRCLGQDPEARFQRATDVNAALCACRVSDRPVAFTGRRRRRAMVALSLAAALLVGAFALYRWRAGPSTRATHSGPVTLAVVPFQIPSADDDIAFFGIAVPDGIISRLAPVKSIRVRALLKAGKEREPPQAVGRALGVEYVLTGTAGKDGTLTRITAQLVRVTDGATVWMRPYTRSSIDLVRLTDEIARDVVTELPVQLSTEERTRMNRRRTTDPATYALYLRGRADLARNRAESTAAAVAVFQSAVDRDAQDALAHAGLAVASAKMGLFFAKENDVSMWHNRAYQAALRALQLDPDLAETHEALAAVWRSTEFDWPRTIEESAQALARNPTLDQPHLFRSSAFMHLGLFARAEAESAAAMDINPANMAEPLRVQGVAAMYDGRSETAVRLLEQASALSGSPAEWNLAYAHYNAGRKREAEAMLRRIRSDSARTQRRAQATLASFLAARGQTHEAMQLIDAIRAGSYMDHHVAYSLGAAFAQLGKPREALKWLAEARTSGFECYPWYIADPLLEPLRQNPDFQRFLEEFKHSWQTNTILHR